MERVDEIRTTMESLIGVPATIGNHVDILRNGDEIFPAMIEAIENAERFIDLLTFIYWKGEPASAIADGLCEKASAGVRVRVLLDTVGARSINQELVAEMREAGADVRWFRPPSWRPWELEHRTHRKVMIVDEKVGFTGGVGIAEEWCGDARDETEWRDTHFRVRGPAIDGLRGAFETNWIETSELEVDPARDAIDQPADGPHTVQVVRSSASIGWSAMAVVIRSLFRVAQERIRVSTAYFTPDPLTLRLLCDAVERGVRVEVLVPGPHADKRVVRAAGEATYDKLLESGVHVWSFQPTMLHTKIITVDDAVACVGSANINSRSMARDDEVAMLLYDTDLVGQLDGHFDEDLKRSERITDATWQSRSPWQRCLETATGLLDKRL